MRIRFKVLAVAGLVGVAALVTAVLGIQTMRSYNERVDGLEQAFQRVYDGEHLNRLVTAVVMESRGIYAAADAAKAKPFADNMGKLLGEMDGLVADWSKRVAPEEKAAFDGVAARAREFVAFRTELARLGVEQSPAAAAEMGNNDANRANRKQLQAEVDTLVELGRTALAAERAGIADYYASRLTLLSVAAGAGILIGLAGAFWLGTAGITRPLDRVRKALAALSAGERDVVLPTTRARDEIGDLWTTVADFRDALAAADRLRAEQAAADERTGAEKRAMMAELSSRFEAEVGDVVAAVSRAAERMLRAAETMAGDADETSRRSITVASASEQTSANVQAVASASEELTSSIAEIGRRIGEASRLIGQAVGQASDTDQEVRTLADAASKVGAIVAMIQAIAEQTNLLALNATIEAARAGEAGRGFAVVASEVKALAGQTAKATQDIEQQMAGIQAATRSTVDKIGDIARRIGELDGIAASVAAAADQQNAATGEIARSIAEAAAGAGEVAETIAGVRHTAEKSGDAARGLLGAATALSDESGRLERQVAAFVGRVRAA